MTLLGLQVGRTWPFSFPDAKKFLNNWGSDEVFMCEGRRLVAGEAILDRTTVERSRDEVLEEMVREHSRLVYRIAYAALRSHHDAEDASQETFVRVLRYGRQLRGIEDPKTWLARIAWRVAVDRSRQRNRKQEIPLETPDAPLDTVESYAPRPDDVALGEQVASKLEALIAALPEKLRQPLILSALEEMSPRDVAATLEINEAAVRSRVFRARQILKEKLVSSFGTKTV